PIQLEDGDAFVFVGDSITHQCLYTQYVEDYYYTRYPSKRIHFHNAGVSGDVANDVLIRMEEDVTGYRPKYASVLIGMNDGHYTPFAHNILETYKRDMTRLVEQLEAAKIRPILMTPTMFDLRPVLMTGGSLEGKDADQVHYNATLAFFGMWALETANERGLGFVNMHEPLNRITRENRSDDPGFTLIEDSVHPGPGGQLVMALAFLKDVGAEPVVSAIHIDVQDDEWNLIEAKNGAFEKTDEDTIRFRFTANSLPWVVPEEAAAGFELADAGGLMSQETVRITGLEPGAYDLRIDGKGIGSYSHLQLASGVELQDNELTPQYQQALKVAALNKERNHETIASIRDLWGTRKHFREVIAEHRDTFTEDVQEDEPDKTVKSHPLEGKSLTAVIEELDFLFVFKEDGTLNVSGGFFDEEKEGTYEQNGTDVSISLGVLKMAGSYDGEEFSVVNIWDDPRAFLLKEFGTLEEEEFVVAFRKKLGSLKKRAKTLEDEIYRINQPVVHTYEITKQKSIALVDTQSAQTAEDVKYSHEKDIVYGYKHGMGLVMDVFTPEKRNGAGVLWIVSGGMHSDPRAVRNEEPSWQMRALLERGYVVFAAMHGSQPKFSASENRHDMPRAIRYIRHHAERFDIDGNRLGAMGFSSGGQLTLLLATAAPGAKSRAEDPTDKESSRLQAAVAYFPGTDMVNFGVKGRTIAEHFAGLGDEEGGPFDFHTWDDDRGAFMRVEDPQERRKIFAECSPISHVDGDDPPTLLFHGDKDRVVPIQQSEEFLKRMTDAGAICKLVVMPDKGHGWGEPVRDEREQMLDWFDRHLLDEAAK
ncbi:MAG: SGNH/GDSL hydrolase family protein, partial [Planctomycetota bacterium]